MKLSEEIKISIKKLEPLAQDYDLPVGEVVKLLEMINKGAKYLEEQKELMLTALKTFSKWHELKFNTNEGCPFDCDGIEDCYECIHVQEFSNYRHIISDMEKIKGKTCEQINE